MSAAVALYQPAPRATPAERTARLTTRRREVAILFARGLSAKLVADRLGISQRTAEAHLADVYRVLEVRNVETYYGPIAALKGISLDVQPGTIVAVLGANARLAAVLARHLAPQPYPVKDDADLLAVGAWLLNQQKPDGRFVTSRSLPSGAAGTDAAPEAEMLAAAALCRIYARTGRPEYLDAAEKAVGALLKLAPLPKATAESVRLDAAQVEAIDALFAAARSRTFVADAEKLGARLLEGQTTQPVFPDFLGGLANSAELEPVAMQTRGVLTAAGLCHGVRHRLMAEKLFAAAHYGLLFQLQGQADAASTLHLPDGTEYGGAFRSSLAGCEFDLATQAKALASLAAAAELLKTLGTETVPVSDDLKRDLQDSLARLGQFPRCLPPNPVAKPAGKSP